MDIHCLQRGTELHSTSSFVTCQFEQWSHLDHDIDLHSHGKDPLYSLLELSRLHVSGNMATRGYQHQLVLGHLSYCSRRLENVSIPLTLLSPTCSQPRLLRIPLKPCLKADRYRHVT